MLRGLSHSNTGYYSVILEGDGKTLDSADNSMWTIPKTVLFFHSDLDPGKNYTLRFRNWRNSHPDCVDGRVVIDTMGTCCQAIDSLTLVGSAMRLSGCVLLHLILMFCANHCIKVSIVRDDNTCICIIRVRHSKRQQPIYKLSSHCG